MKKSFLKHKVLRLICLAVALLSPLFAFSQTGSDAQPAAKVKAKINSIGVGPIIFVWLKDKDKLTGNIVRINSTDFVFKNAESGNEQTINYSDVTQIKRVDKRGFSNGLKALLIVAGGLFVVGLISNGGG
ncbi:MAG: hypothetical protein M3209_12940 [Acidobacteriota bacterium]|nr:hypothetical protein [Acidobacteriota bacterium]